MPASITHELIAEEATDLLPAGAKKVVSHAFGYYILGAQGPDLFFFYKPLSRRTENLGKRLHRRQVYDFFTALMKALPDFTGEEFEKCLAYALGFCSHLAADVIFHPFVYNYLAQNVTKKHTHQRIENDWDVYFLRELKSRSVIRHEYPFDLKEIAKERALFLFLKDALGSIGIGIKEGAFGRMMKHFGRYLSHFHKGGVRALRPFGLTAFYPNRTPSKEFLSGKDFPRYAEGQGKNADALFLRATEESASCIEAFLEAFNKNLPLSEALFARHLLTGKPI